MISVLTIKWIKYDPEFGEVIEFCCDAMKKAYGISITWDPGAKRWCKREKRKTKYQDPYSSKFIFKTVEGIEDLIPIDKCEFCGSPVDEQSAGITTFWIPGPILSGESGNTSEFRGESVD